MTPGVRKFALTAHVTSSVGWLGAVAGFLALAVAGLTSQDAQMVRAAYLAMELTSWFVIVPLSLASPLTGLVQSLGTTWGLFRHYWVVAKLLMTIPASIVLLLHMQPISRIADVAAETTLSSTDLGGLRIRLVANAGAALLVLLVATTLSVYKPKGRTPYGRLKQHEQLSADALPYADSNGGTWEGTLVGPGRRSATSTPRWVYVSVLMVTVLILLFLIQHLSGGGLWGHA
ncbi:MAG: hypothetical protein ACR2G6_08915 [Gemmatimonadaceae bacterium]